MLEIKIYSVSEIVLPMVDPLHVTAVLVASSSQRRTPLPGESNTYRGIID